MPCSSPICIKTVPRVDEKPSVRQSFRHVLVPCGKCDYCRAQRLDAIVERLKFEYDSAFQTLFVGYSYDEEHVKTDLSKDDAKLILRNLKNNFNRHYATFDNDGKMVESFKYKYFLVGEYGDLSGRVHFHLLLFLPRTVDWHYIQESNPFGIKCDIQVAGRGSMYYVAMYCVKELIDPDNPNYKGKAEPFYLQSNGIGADMVKTRLAKSLRIEKTYQYRDAAGYNHSLGRYLRSKVFNAFERLEISDKIAASIPVAMNKSQQILDNDRFRNRKVSDAKKVQKIKSKLNSSVL